jgi:hypothetical protein
MTSEGTRTVEYLLGTCCAPQQGSTSPFSDTQVKNFTSFQLSAYAFRYELVPISFAWQVSATHYGDVQF